MTARLSISLICMSLLAGCLGNDEFTRIADQAPDWFKETQTGYPRPCRKDSQTNRRDATQTSGEQTTDDAVDLPAAPDCQK